MKTPTRREYTPTLTRKGLQEYAYQLEKIILPKELENYLLAMYGDDFFLDDEGRMCEFSEQDIWENVRNSIEEYAHIKKRMDDLLTASEYLGSSSLTIHVNNNRIDTIRMLWYDDKTREAENGAGGGADIIPFPF